MKIDSTIMICFVRFSAIILLNCMLMSGCATATPQMIYVSPAMLPEGNRAKPAHRSALFNEQTLVIAPVTGVGDSNLRALGGSLGLRNTAIIWSQMFKEALFKSLWDSGLFGKVARSGSGRYALHADILQQSSTGQGAIFEVSYVLTDTNNRHDIWTHTVKINDVSGAGSFLSLATYNGQLNSLMKACGKNIGVMIDELATFSTQFRTE